MLTSHILTTCTPLFSTHHTPQEQLQQAHAVDIDTAHRKHMTQLEELQQQLQRATRDKEEIEVCIGVRIGVCMFCLHCFTTTPNHLTTTSQPPHNHLTTTPIILNTPQPPSSNTNTTRSVSTHASPPSSMTSPPAPTPSLASNNNSLTPNSTQNTSLGDVWWLKNVRPN